MNTQRIYECMCTPCSEYDRKWCAQMCTLMSKHVFNLNTCTCIGAQKHLFNACHTLCKRCTCTRACALTQRCRNHCLLEKTVQFRASSWRCHRCGVAQASFIFRVDAGLIQMVYALHSPVAAKLILDKSLFPPLILRREKNSWRKLHIYHQRGQYYNHCSISIVPPEWKEKQRCLPWALLSFNQRDKKI